MPLIQAELFRLGDVIYAAPYVLKPSTISSASKTDEAEIGAKALEALEASVTGDRPDPAMFTRETQQRWRVPLLQASGYPSLDAFEAAAQYVLLDHSNEDFVLLPSRRGKPGEEYTHLHRKMMTFRVKDSRELGIAIIRGFALCEDHVPPLVTPGIAGEILGVAVPPFRGNPCSDDRPHIGVCRRGRHTEHLIR